MTQKELNAAGFIVNDRSIEPMTYREYLNEYGQDLTTTPRGVADRCHIREVTTCMYRKLGTDQSITEADYNDLHDDEQSNYECIGEMTTEWQMWSWGVNGNNPRYSGTSFDNEEDAELYYYERSEWYVSEKNWNAPRWHSTYEEAIQDMADMLDRSVEVIKRHQSLLAITAWKEAEHRAIVTKEYDTRKAWLAVEVPKEADSITIDEEFIAAIKWAEAASGNEKSNRMASAMKGLLARNGKEKIETDFWQVIRILKAKAQSL